MPSEREIDALVAEKVMGFGRSTTPPDWPQQWRMPSKNPSAEHRKEYPYWYKSFEPSTKIADAWEVVEKMAPDDDEFRLTRHRRGRWLCTFKFFDGLSEGAETAPMAICLAALAVFGVDPAGKGEK